MGLDIDMLLTHWGMVQMQHTLLSACCNTVGERATLTCTVTGDADLVRDFVTGPVMNGVNNDTILAAKCH